MNLIHAITFKQDVYIAWDEKTKKSYFTDDPNDPSARTKFHSKGDKHLASDHYKADLDASNVKYETVESVPMAFLAKMCRRWKKACQDLGHDCSAADVPEDISEKAWATVHAELGD